MPELPDVETYRKYIEATALHKRISTVTVSDDAVIQGQSGSGFAGNLQGRSFEKTERHGKFCFLALDDGHQLALHFGMTGFVKYYKVEEHASDHIRVAFAFDNGYTLAYDCRRKLGQLELIDTTEDFKAAKHLGPDAMDPDFSAEDFLAVMDRRRGMLKSALMNQRTIAGIGNVYSDEILHQEGLHPTVKIRDLDKDRLRHVHQAMRNIMEQVIAAGIDSRKMPEWLLTAHRGGDMRCPSCGGDLDKIKVAGRSSIFCPACQGG